MVTPTDMGDVLAKSKSSVNPVFHIPKARESNFQGAKGLAFQRVGVAYA